LYKHECIVHGRPSVVRPGIIGDSGAPVKDWQLVRCIDCGVVMTEEWLYKHKQIVHWNMMENQNIEKCDICGDSSDGIAMSEHVRIVHSGDFKKCEMKDDHFELVWNGTMSENSSESINLDKEVVLTLEKEMVNMDAQCKEHKNIWMSFREI
jgi:hypothetical protein